jgi:hypothetical protein
MAKIKTADEQIVEGQVAIKRVQELYVELVVALEEVRLMVIAMSESPMITKRAEEYAALKVESMILGGSGGKNNSTD